MDDAEHVTSVRADERLVNRSSTDPTRHTRIVALRSRRAQGMGNPATNAAMAESSACAPRAQGACRCAMPSTIKGTEARTARASRASAARVSGGLAASTSASSWRSAAAP
jgi:hypothetical protein